VRLLFFPTLEELRLMAKSPTGIIPERLMHAGAIAEVMRFLIELPVEGDDKVELLIGWARAVGQHVSSSQRQRVRASGVDYQ